MLNWWVTCRTYEAWVSKDEFAYFGLISGVVVEVAVSLYNKALRGAI